MEYKMKIFALVLCVFPAITASITVSSNGNSPEIKMLGGMMVDSQGSVVSTTPKEEMLSTPSNYEKSRQITSNTTNLSINERYRRLIPYMTFYYANDLTTPTDASKAVEVEKAEIVEAKDMDQHNHRHPKKIIYTPQRTIPRYQGNRLTQFNIASANPTQVFYKDGVRVAYHNPNKVTPNYNPLQPEYVLVNHNYDPSRFPSKLISKPQVISIATTTRKPYINLYKGGVLPNIRYYAPEKDLAPKFKLVPYEQTPPAKVISQSEKVQDVSDVKKPYVVSILVPKEQVHVNPRPTRPQIFYDNSHYQSGIRKHPTIVSENYYEKQRPPPLLIQPLIESGFKPIVAPPEYTTQATVYRPVSPKTQPSIQNQKLYAHIEPISEAPAPDYNPHYYDYVVEQPTYKPEENKATNGINIAELIKSLQLNKSIPKPITHENVGASIRTLLQVLNAMKATPQHNDVESLVQSTPKPFVAQNVFVPVTDPPLRGTSDSTSHDEDYETIRDEPFLAPVKIPSQHLDDFPVSGGSSQQFPLPVTSDDEGGTPGRPGIDYPILTTIPQTAFNCKTQRYKGFFADTETRCQVWHYCDLNGGQASFLCPNGTIFSQAGLTCDWWFNVRCASTTQLYVLNESLYKFILPHSPKFPEDYSGPLVDKYLTLKFKEMEEQFKKNKGKQSNAEDKNSDDEDDSNKSSEEEESDNPKATENNDTSTVRTISVASVVIESPGNSGKVERLQI
ncbi:uncharacterized protein LOC115445295 isoform X1 [Manduca sexta]|uniref:uncharacterized protein LOC115445295 isoform X1 n=2 Tax=Manduca sexta TaxID=7130 RepID=UPI00189024E8|nr:uncharacterized protein LOC115445295 isoform X1 [Manduca sexta]